MNINIYIYIYIYMVSEVGLLSHVHLEGMRKEPKNDKLFFGLALVSMRNGG